MDIFYQQNHVKSRSNNLAISSTQKPPTQWAQGRLLITCFLMLFGVLLHSTAVGQCANFGIALSQDFDCDGVINSLDLDDDLGAKYRDKQPLISLEEENSNVSNYYFIDAAVADASTLEKAVLYSKIKSQIEFFTHGRSGELFIQGKWMGAEEIARFIKEQFPFALGKLSYTGKQNSLNIYGCEFAKGKKGLEAVSYLEKALGLSVAASTNITGKGGDWILEMGSKSRFEEIDYNHDLQTISPTNGTARCNTCAPSGWTIIPGTTPDISTNLIISNINANGTINGGASGSGATWNVPGGALPLPSNNHTEYVALRDLGPSFAPEGVTTTVTGLTAGRVYELVFYALTARSNRDGTPDYGGTFSWYGGTYENDAFGYRVNGGTVQNITAISQDVWGIKRFSFTATGTTATLTLQSGTNGTFVPDANATNNSVNKQPTLFSVSANAINAIPVANNDNANTTSGNLVTINVVSNDVDYNDAINNATVDLNPSSAGIQTSLTTAQGTWAVNAAGVVSFTPLAAFTGTATIPYTISDTYTLDGNPQPATSSSANISVSVTAPTMVAANDNFTGIAPGGTTPSVFTNDNANGTTPATDALVTTPTVVNAGGLTGVTFNADGTANIPAGASAGTYNVTYSVCLTSNPTTCSQTVMTVAVVNTLIGGVRPFDDFDGDSIINSADLDDDNDGILDADECAGTANVLWTPGTINGIERPFTLSNSGFQTTGSVFYPNTGAYLSNLGPNGFPAMAFNENQTSNGTYRITFDEAVSDATLSIFGLVSSSTTSNAVGDFKVILQDGSVYSNVGAIGLGTDPLGVNDAVSTAPAVLTVIGGINYYARNPTGNQAEVNVTYNSSNVPQISSTNGIVEIQFTQQSTQAANATAWFGVSASIACDSDNDGIANQFDLDSDGDGCPDAIEGGGSFTLANLTSNMLTGSVDANGVPTVATASGQTIGSSQNASIVVCCDPLVSGFPDNDQDGVSDLCDLDDDNDGILDTDEICAPSPVDFTGFVESVPGDASQTFTTDVNGTTLPADFTISAPILVTGTPTALIRNSAEEVINFRMSNAAAGDAVSFDIDLTSPQVVFFSADNDVLSSLITNSDRFILIPKGTVSGAFSWNVSNTSDVNVSFSGNQVIIDGTALTSAGPFGQFLISPNEPITGYTVLYETLSPIASNGSNNTRINISYCSRDLDNDGIDNQFDLDSDGDGCPDAIEGGGSFTSADVDGDGALTGAVDANGVPTAATASGQSVGSSQDALVQSCLITDNDTFSAVAPSSTTPSVFTNDNANGTTPGTDALLTTPTVVDAGGLTGITFNADGTANIPLIVAGGTYNVTYSVCLESNPSICAQAVATIVVIEPICTTAGTASFATYVTANPTAAIALADCDGDGFSNIQEVTAGSDPSNISFTPVSDQDGDGALDINEPAGGIINPCLPVRTVSYTGYVASNVIWAAADCDNDGFTNGVEATVGSDPYSDTSSPVDLFPNFTFGNTSYLSSNERFVVININEIRGHSTAGNIQFFIPNVSGFQLDFDNTLTTATVLGPESVSNSLWTMTNNGIGLLFSSNDIISAGNRSRIVLKVTALTAGSVANLTVNIVQGSGGEANTSNNVGVLSKSIQN